MAQPVDPLIERLHSGQFHPQALVEATEAPLDAQRVLSSVRLLGVGQHFWQYTHLTALCFEHQGQRYLYLPTPSVAGLHQLQAVPVERLGGPARDLAPLVLEDLRRGAQAQPSATLALLDLLATFRGWGRSSLDLPGVVSSESAPAALADRGLQVDQARLRSEPGRLRGLLERVDPTDGTAGGFKHTLALGELHLTATSWLYRREELWREEEDGIPLS